MKTLLLGLGNPILHDDAVGLIVARRVYDMVRNRGGSDAARVELTEASVAGMNILDLVQGYDRVIVIDSILTSGGMVGQLHEGSIDDLAMGLRLRSPHGVDFALAIELGKALGAAMPASIRIYGIEVADPYTFGEELSPEVMESVPRVAAAIASAEFGCEAT